MCLRVIVRPWWWGCPGPIRALAPAGGGRPRLRKCGALLPLPPTHLCVVFKNRDELTFTWLSLSTRNFLIYWLKKCVTESWSHLLTAFPNTCLCRCLYFIHYIHETDSNFYSLVVIICATSFNVKKLHFFHSVFHVVLKIKSNYFPREHEAMDIFNEYELCSPWYGKWSLIYKVDKRLESDIAVLSFRPLVAGLPQRKP